MKNLLDDIPSVLLLGPGPSPVAPATYHALSCSTLGHLDPYFFTIMDGIKAGLQQVMGTANQVTVPVSGTGSAGMEAAFVNMIQPGDKALILVNGVFGRRMVDVAGRLGAEVTALEFTWGTPVDVDAVAAQLKKERYHLVAVVHAETSTGVKNPVAEIGALVKESGSLYLVDAVTSLGGLPLALDDWGVDVCYSGSQKCLSCPPGLSPFTMSDQAVQVLRQRKTKVPNWYLDMNMLTQYWGGGKRVYHHTAPINMVYGLYQSLHNLIDEGLDQAYARHQACHEQLVEGFAAMGWEMLVEKDFRLPMLNTIKVPANVDEARLRADLLNKYHIEIGGGLGDLAGQIIRVGLMGYGAKSENVSRLLCAVKECLAG